MTQGSLAGGRGVSVMEGARGSCADLASGGAGTRGLPVLGRWRPQAEFIPGQHRCPHSVGQEPGTLHSESGVCCPAGDKLQHWKVGTKSRTKLLWSCE